MTANKLVKKFIEKQITAMKIRAFTSIAKVYNVFFSQNFRSRYSFRSEICALQSKFSGESARD